MLRFSFINENEGIEEYLDDSFKQKKSTKLKFISLQAKNRVSLLKEKRLK